jgi:hypothetical protein
LLAPTSNRDSRLGTALVLSRWAALALGLPGLRLVLLGLRLFANLLDGRIEVLLKAIDVSAKNNPL